MPSPTARWEPSWCRLRERRRSSAASARLPSSPWRWSSWPSSIVLRYEPEHSTALGFVEMFEGVFLVWMLAAVYFARGIMARLLGSRPLVAIGKVSFGLYIYHIFVIIII